LARISGPRKVVGQQQDQPGMACRIRSPIARRRLSFQFHAFALGSFITPSKGMAILPFY